VTRASRLFDESSQKRFAELSGDRNPIHLDALASRRTLAGAPVVHGIHTLLWVLDCVASETAESETPRQMKVRFQGLVYVGDSVDVEIAREDTTFHARVRVEGADVLTATIRSDFRQGRQLPVFRPEAPLVTLGDEAEDLAFERLAGRDGQIPLGQLTAAAAQEFPYATRYLGAERVAALMRCSCLVGMVVPGLHSLFGGLELSFTGNEAPGPLQFAVVSVDERFRLVCIAVRGCGLQGFLNANARSPPVSQPSMEEVVRFVQPDEFRGSTALIVGGSRGLGELTAKLVAAGGGSVTLTYARGKADAESVADQIDASGGTCEVARYDVVASDAASQLAALKRSPTQVYYFATPPLPRRSNRSCDLRHFAQLSVFYLRGFQELIEACRQMRPEGLSVFYPSSVYVAERPAGFTEYAMSKAAGEILCADLQRYHPEIRIVTRRLPRLPTDQTVSLIPETMADAVGVMLPIIREVQGASEG
jgi:acyl dehydratase